VQALRRHVFAWCFERHDGSTKCDPQKRSERTPERVADDPDISVRIHVRDVVVQILVSRKPVGGDMTTKEQTETYDASGVKQTLIDQSVLNTLLVAFPAAAVAIAHGPPRPSNARTTTTEQEVVVQLVLLCRRPSIYDRR